MEIEKEKILISGLIIIVWEFFISHFFEIAVLVMMWGIINWLEKIYFELVTIRLK